MSRIISFAWTSPALIFGAKVCTRRDWDHHYAARFQNGEIVFAYDRSPRARGNHIAILRLAAKPSWQPMSLMPDSDYEAEGFAWSLVHPDALPRTIEGTPRDHFIRSVTTKEGFERWRQSGQSMYVIRFELVSLTEEGERQKQLIDPKPILEEVYRASKP